MEKKTPIQMLKDATAQVDALTASIEALKTEHATALAELTGKVDALTVERDTLKADAEKAQAEKDAAEKAKAEADTALADLSGKLSVAEQKLRDPALLAAAGKEAPAPVAGLSGEASGETPEKKLEKLNKDYAMEKDPIVRGRIRREIVALKNKEG